MIFIIVGIEKFPFDRFLKAIDNGIRSGKINEEVFAQIGNSKYTPSSFRYTQFLPFNEVIDLIKAASVLVTHAGVGSTLLCLELGKIPIIFPRIANLGEHLDDHQVEFAKQMEKERKVLAAYNEEDLLNKIKDYKNLIKRLNNPSTLSSKNNLLSFLKDVIKGEN